MIEATGETTGEATGEATGIDNSTSAGTGNNGLWFYAAAYVGLFLFSYFMFLIATFPYDILVKGVAGNFKQSIPSELQPLEFDKFTPDLPLGAVIEGLSMGRSSGGGPLLEADMVEFSAAAMKALWGEIDARLDAEMYGGKLIASFAGDLKGGKLNLKFAGLKLELLNQLKDLTKLDLYGKAHGNLEYEWSPNFSENKAHLSLTIDGGKAKNVNLKLMTLDIDFSKVEGEFTLEKRILTINRCVLEGDPSGIELEGTIRLNEGDLSASYMDLWVTFSPTGELKNNIPFSLLQEAGEGKYKGHLRGTFKNPQFP